MLGHVRSAGDLRRPAGRRAGRADQSLRRFPDPQAGLPPRPPRRSDGLSPRHRGLFYRPDRLLRAQDQHRPGHQARSEGHRGRHPHSPQPQAHPRFQDVQDPRRGRQDPGGDTQARPRRPPALRDQPHALHVLDRRGRHGDRPPARPARRMDRGGLRGRLRTGVLRLVCFARPGRAELFRKLLFYMGLALVAFAIYTLGTVFI